MSDVKNTRAGHIVCRWDRWDHSRGEIHARWRRFRFPPRIDTQTCRASRNSPSPDSIHLLHLFTPESKTAERLPLLLRRGVNAARAAFTAGRLRRPILAAFTRTLRLCVALGCALARHRGAASTREPSTAAVFETCLVHVPCGLGGRLVHGMVHASFTPR